MTTTLEPGEPASMSKVSVRVPTPLGNAFVGIARDHARSLSAELCVAMRRHVERVRRPRGSAR
jgi:hypothetical protein